jgi:hypothetical protein
VATVELRSVSTREKSNLPGSALRRSRYAQASIERKGSTPRSDEPRLFQSRKTSPERSRECREASGEERVGRRVRRPDPDAVEEYDDDPAQPVLRRRLSHPVGRRSIVTRTAT